MISKMKSLLAQVVKKYVVPLQCTLLIWGIEYIGYINLLGMCQHATTPLMENVLYNAGNQDSL